MGKIQNNKELRIYHKQLRDNMALNEKNIETNEIINNLLALLESDFKGADIFLCFYPFKSEINLLPFYNKLLNEGKKLYFPKSDLRTHKLYFYQISDLEEDFNLGCYNIMEPNDKLPAFKMENDMVIAITPGLIFDYNFNRIGYGGGFYDRFFESNDKIIRVAPTFSNQLVSELKVESHDLPMDYIVTGNHILKGNRL